jgi:hypothetical protein
MQIDILEKQCQINVKYGKLRFPTKLCFMSGDLPAPAVVYSVSFLNFPQ